MTTGVRSYRLNQDHCSLQWYKHWLERQIDRCPKSLFSVLPTAPKESADSKISLSFVSAWVSVAQALKDKVADSIDDVIHVLLKYEQIDLMDESPDKFDVARSLVFAMIGWQSMLFKSDYGSAPPKRVQLVDEMDGFRGESRLVLQQNASACKRSIPDLLLGFGVLLPPPNFCAGREEAATRSFYTKKTVEARQLNAAHLTSLAQVEIRWVDSISCHLELDQHSGVLYLFRFPSFCALDQLDVDKTAPSSMALTSTLHACGISSSSARQWASADEISQLLREILISYRLLFGQLKQGRKLFKRLRPFGELDKRSQDRLLFELCGQEKCHASVLRFQRDIYSLADDFPMLRAKVAALDKFLSQRKPRTWKQLWHDKRDGGQWFTFWAVLIVGGVGLVLAFVQVVLQILQLALPTHH